MPLDTTELTSSELAVLESLHGASQSVSQRELARRTGFSVGLVNAVIKKLVHTGYVKTAHLNKRQFEYLLTPEGFARTALRSYNYVLDTVRRFQAVHTNLKSVIDRLRADGVKEFYLHGDGELAEVVSLFCEEIGAGTVKRGLPMAPAVSPARGPRRVAADSRRAVVLNATPHELTNGNWRVIDLISELRNGSLAEGAKTGGTATGTPHIIRPLPPAGSQR